MAQHTAQDKDQWNQAAGNLTGTEQPQTQPEPPPESTQAPQPAPSGRIAAMLTELQQVRDQGLISADELAAKRAQILADYGGTDSRALFVPMIAPAQATLLRPAKDRSTALILEIVAGVFGIYGIGWVYAGHTDRGIKTLVGGLIWGVFAAPLPSSRPALARA